MTSSSQHCTAGRRERRRRCGNGYAVADLRRGFRDALSRRGMGEDDIETLFQDFHEVLNRS